MAHRCVVIVDSDTGAMIDIAGNARETGRYARFAGRMLSPDTNPQLNYGINGGDTLTISKNGNSGAAINLVADVVNVSKSLKVGGRTVEEISEEGASYVMDLIKGSDGEISVDTEVDEGTGVKYAVISLDPALSTAMEKLSTLVDNIGEWQETTDTRLDTIESSQSESAEAVEQLGETVTALDSRVDSAEAAVEQVESALDDRISKQGLAEAISGIYIADDDGLEEVKYKFNLLLARLAELAGSDSSGSAEG